MFGDIWKKRTIKRSMLLPLCTVLTILLFVIGLVTYQYFLGILKEQGISDDRKTLEQTGQQLRYMGEEVEYFSKTILTDDDIQSFITTQYYEDVFDEVFTAWEIRDKLKQYTFMKENVNDIMIHMPQKDTIWSLEKDNDRARKETEEEWFLAFQEEKTHGFSTIHGNTLDRSGRYISYIYPFVSYYLPNEPMGSLIVNMDMEPYDEIVRLTAQDYDSFYWVLDKKWILYEKNGESRESLMNRILKWEESAGGESCYVVNEKDGYWIVYEITKYGWLLASFVSNDRIEERIEYLRYFFAVFVLLSVFVVMAVMIPMITRITRPIRTLSTQMAKVSKADFKVRFSANEYDELKVMSDSFNYMVEELELYVKKIEAAESARYEMEEQLLLSQVNPHFIYNVLNTVIFLARKGKNEEVVEVVDSFIRILRDAVKPEEERMFATVGQELDILQHYLRIQKYRYQDAYQVIFDVEEETLEVPVPRTLLQPLVENAIIHGVLADEKEEQGLIILRVWQRNGCLIIQVEDNGAGMEESRMEAFQKGIKMKGGGSKMKSIGLPNIVSRLSYLYEGNASLEVKKGEMGGTQINITIIMQNLQE